MQSRIKITVRSVVIDTGNEFKITRSMFRKYYTRTRNVSRN